MMRGRGWQSRGWLLAALLAIGIAGVAGCSEPKTYTVAPTATPELAPTTVVVEQAAAPVEATRPAEPEPTAPPPIALFVANTDGSGVYLRREPGDTDRIKAWGDGTRMLVVGADES